MISMWSGKTSRAGFTLLEILVSMALIAIALLAVFRLQAQSLDIQSEARFATVAGLMAQQRLALIHAESNLRPGVSTGEFEEPFSGFQYRQEIQPVSGVQGIFRVDLQVTSGGDGRARSYRVTSWMYREVAG